jgi:hypothetical protein
MGNRFALPILGAVTFSLDAVRWAMQTWLSKNGADIRRRSRGADSVRAWAKVTLEERRAHATLKGGRKSRPSREGAGNAGAWAAPAASRAIVKSTRVSHHR